MTRLALYLRRLHLRLLHFRLKPFAVIATGLLSAGAAVAQSYTLTPQIASIPAAAYGANINAGVTGDTSSVLDFGVCFYTGYGSATPIVPSAFTPSATGAATVAFTIPPSPIQEIPPPAFSGGVFSALLYTVPLTATLCTGQDQASNSITLPINYPVLTSINLASVPQQNPNLATRLPARIDLHGTNFASQTGAASHSPSMVLFTAIDSFAGDVAYVNTVHLNSTIPTQIPGDATSVEVSACNTAVFSYCSTSISLAMTPLQSDFGTLVATPSVAAPLQPITLSATFGPATPSLAGAPSGLATFTDAGTVIASSPLLLDTTATFVPAQHAAFNATSMPLEPIVADLNNDGIPDVIFIEPNAVANSKHLPIIHILLGKTPAGQFSRDYAFSDFNDHPCGTLVSSAVADFNGDGYPDLAVLCQNASAAGAISEVIYTLRNPGNGDLSYIVASFGPVYGQSIVAADFNHDGKTDLVIAGTLDAEGRTGFQLLTGLGNCYFAAGPSSRHLDTLPSADFGGFQIAAADLNNDGFPDIAILNGTSASGSVDPFIQLFQNNGKGVFTRSASVPTDGTSTAKFFIAPLQPGQPKDLIVTSVASSAPGIYVVPNSSAADIAFAASSTFTPVTGLAQAVVGDFNGDGVLDVAVKDAKSLHVLTGDGTGAFAATYRSLSTGYPADLALIAASDENGDGYADLLGVKSNTPNPSGTIPTALIDYVTSGTASVTVTASGLASGVHRILANTPGTDGIAGAGAEATVTITGGSGSASITSIAASVTSPQSFGAPITLYGSVLDPAATGSLSFYSGSTLYGTATLSTASGAPYASASVTLQPLPAGTYSFQVVYTGDTTHGRTTSAILPFTIDPIAPVVAWNPTQAILAYGAPLSASQQNATASGLAGAAVPGSYAYNPAPQTVLGIGTHTLSVTFTSSSTNYTSATATASITIDPATPGIVWAPNPGTIPFGTALSNGQLNAYAATPNVASVPGRFTYTAAIGNVLPVGVHTLNVAFTPTDAVDYRPASASVTITVGKANPVLAWATPADAVAGTLLSPTQLDATAIGVDGAPLAGTFTYTPAVGAALAGGSQKLSVLFVPADTTDYNSASASVTINVVSDALSGLIPNTGSLGDPATTVTLTGTGFLATSVVQMNGAAVPTVFVSSKTITAIVPAAQLKTVQAIQVAVYDPVQNQTSNALAFAVTAPSTSVDYNAPTSITPASENTVTFKLSPYPADVNATFTLGFQPATGLTNDPMIVFASSGEPTATVHVAAHSDVLSLPVEFASGTVAGTLTLTLALEAGGANVTPASIQPIVIREPVAVPGVSSVTFSQDGNLLTLFARGYSNTRAVSSANFHFTASPGHSVKTSDLTVAAGPLFSTWYTGTTSQQYGSEFTYTETFNLDSDSAAVGQVSVTLTNDTGTSQEAKTP